MKVQFSSKNVLLVLLLIFIIFDIQVPNFVSQFLSSVFGKVFLFAASIFLYSQGPLVGSLALVAAYLLLVRTNNVLSIDTQKFIPSEKKKQVFFEKNLNNHFPKTLEEEMVSHMVPLIKDIPIIDSPFIPVVESSYDAKKV